LRKKFCFPIHANHFYKLLRPDPQEGRCATSSTRDGMRWTPAALKTRSHAGGRRSRVVLTPRRLVSSRRKDDFADDGNKIARSPGRARRKPLKPLRGECRVFSGVTVVTTLACLFYFTCEAAGASSARHSLRPLHGGTRKLPANLGRIARRECGVMSVAV